MLEKAMKAAKRYIELKGYEFVEEFESHIVMRDNDELVFVAVTVALDDLPEVEADRKAFELLAARYFAAQDEFVYVPFRFDKIDLHVVGPDRAVLRHHINCLGQA